MKKPRGSKYIKRNKKIIAMCEKETYEAIGIMFGLTKQRIQQIYKKQTCA